MAKIALPIALCITILIIGNPVSATTAEHALSAQKSKFLEHGGRTDKNGCHRDRKAGTRHCH